MSTIDDHSGRMPTACVILIGNELLSGKTQDANLSFLGGELSRLGIRLAEARVIPDDEAVIIATVNELRAVHDHVFTTGGIGPTHDDITALSVARAFGRELVLNEQAVDRMRRGRHELNEARLKMAHVPEDATLIANPTTYAPGFRVENVYVLAGIPSVARSMFETLAESLDSGRSIVSASVDVFLFEGELAAPLQQVAAEFPELDIGSYPFRRDERHGANLVVRGMDTARVEAALGRIIARMSELAGPACIGEPDRSTGSARPPPERRDNGRKPGADGEPARPAGRGLRQ